MDRLRRDVILIRLIEALRKQGSWCGETHVQKAAYLLQEMVGARTGFEFILYKHGPFSFDLRDELSAMRADGFVSLRVQDPAYGPSIVPEPAADVLRKHFSRTLREHEAGIQFVSERLKDRRVVELERLATAFYVSRHAGADQNVLAQKVHSLKPHISVDEALTAVRTVRTWAREAEVLRGDSDA
jgi:uncharacterized protein YwgA